MKKTILTLTLITTLTLATTNTLTIDKAKELCSNKNANGCKSLGMRYFNGDGVKIDDAKSNYYNKLACDYGDGVSCRNYGYELLKGRRGLKKNVVKAFIYYEKACEISKRDGTIKNKYNNCTALKMSKSRLSKKDFISVYGDTNTPHK